MRSNTVNITSTDVTTEAVIGNECKLQFGCNGTISLRNDQGALEHATLQVFDVLGQKVSCEVTTQTGTLVVASVVGYHGVGFVVVYLGIEPIAMGKAVF